MQPPKARLSTCAAPTLRQRALGEWQDMAGLPLYLSQRAILARRVARLMCGARVASDSSTIFARLCATCDASVRAGATLPDKEDLCAC